MDLSAEATTLTHPEWLGLLLDREASYRRDKRLLARLRYARLRHQASIEDVDYSAARGLAISRLGLHEKLLLNGLPQVPLETDQRSVADYRRTCGTG